MKWYSYLNSAEQILTDYTGELPFHHFIKQYFRMHKKYGSKDRRWISQCCFSFFRIGRAIPDEPVQDRILVGLFLTAADPADCYALLRPDWSAWLAENPAANTPDRMTFIKTFYPAFSLEAVFPFSGESGGLTDPAAFAMAHFIQPELFLRVRPGAAETVRKKLKTAEIAYTECGESGLAISNGVAVDQLLRFNKEVVVQDASSQQVGELLQMAKERFASGKKTIWDCCAASGGKSILARDILGEMNLTVSDIRESILHNLRVRLQEAGLGKYQAFAADLSKCSAFIPLQAGQFDLIMADVPCSGSGTWSRTPEQLTFFREEQIATYATLQYGIISRVLPYLKPGGMLLYITCSVFEKENEAQVRRLQHEHALQVIAQRYFEGYTSRADTMFACLLTSSH